jgi:hypothetical protein
MSSLQDRVVNAPAGGTQSIPPLTVEEEGMTTLLILLIIRPNPLLASLRCYYTHPHNKRRAATQTGYQEISYLYRASACSSRFRFVEQQCRWCTHGRRCTGYVLNRTVIVPIVSEEEQDDMRGRSEASRGIREGTNKDWWVTLLMLVYSALTTGTLKRMNMANCEGRLNS